MAKKIVKFMCTAFRDGFQSVYGARVLTDDFMPAVAAARDAGITWFEAGGGAIFQSLYFYCNQDAFDRMDKFREITGPDANLQTLARGVSVVGLDSQSSDVVDQHAKLFKKHGMTTIRNFDALNDANNLIYSGQCIEKAGLKHQVCVTMMELPPGCKGAHDADYYEKTLKDIIDAKVPFDSVCFKDATGTSVPSTVHETIKRARKILPADTLIHFHTHETAGISVQGYMAAIEAGADAIDLSLAPVSGGTCQPDVAVMWHALRGTNYELDVDIDKVMKAELVFKDCMKDYFLPPEAIAVEPMTPWSPMPGGALTANTQMLRDNNIMDRYPEIIAAMEEAVRLGGFGTSVTPVSQFYFQQAFNNVMFGPWEKIAEGYGNMVLGYFGKTPVPPDPKIVKIAEKQMGKPPTTKLVLEINDADKTKGLAVATKLITDAGLPTTDENLFIAATCKQKGIDYLQGNATVGVRKNTPEADKSSAAASEPSGYTVTVNNKKYEVTLEDNKATVNGKSYKIDVQEATGSTKPKPQPAKTASVAPAKPKPQPAKTTSVAPAQPKPQPAKTASVAPSKPKPQPANTAGGGTQVNAAMPGIVFKAGCKVGDNVKEGDVLLILEAMKMEIEVKSPGAGTVASVAVKKGEQVAAGQLLVSLN